MRIFSSEVAALRLRTDDMDEPLESKGAYSSRVRSVFPNLPPEVIGQWFYEHSDSFEANYWLDYASVSFSLEQFSVSKIMQPCLSENPVVIQYRDHFQKNNSSRRMSRIAEYIDLYGTWPVPPILLANPKGEILTSWGFRCDSPFHLLEGSHRFAVLYAFAEMRKMSGMHEVWIATLG